MKKFKVVLFSVGLLFTMVLMSFTANYGVKVIGLSIKDIDKSVVKINEKLYAGAYEVRNSLYLEFIQDLTSKNKTDLLKKAMLDTLNWRDKLAYNEPYVELYFRHPAYANYPVVNVTYEAANLFCEWLTETYNTNPNRNFKKVLFRLPTEAEWEFASAGGTELSTYPWGNSLFQNNHFMCNYKHIGDENLRSDSLTKKVSVVFNDYGSMVGSLNDGADITAPVDGYYANKFGLYNVCGNVAEMVKEKGLSKGGGWKSLGGDVRIKSKEYYTKSATDLGFRYFMEVVEK